MKPKNSVSREEAMKMLSPKKVKNKYHAKKAVVDNITFDSRREARKYSELCMLKKKGFIKGFERQVPYPFIHKGQKICEYRADFVVTENDGTVKVIDTKGHLTAMYRLKRKMMMIFYNIDVIEE